MKWFGPPWRLALCLETCRELYRYRMVSPVKLTQSAGSPKWVGSQVSRGPALLRRSLQGVFPRIKLTTLEIVLINLSTTDQHNMYETYFQQIETSSQLEGSGTALRAEGNLFILNKK